ncbi:hypothetical protein ACHAPO_010864, partial [Fusarium lateritium]
GAQTIRRNELEELDRLGPDADLVAYPPGTDEFVQKVYHQRWEVFVYEDNRLTNEQAVFKYYSMWQYARASWKEMNLWMRLPRHENIVPFDRVVIDEIEGGVVGFTSVYVPGGSLEDNKSGVFKLKWLQQLIEVSDELNLVYGISHQDIAPRNLVVNETTDCIMLFDFNFAARINHPPEEGEAYVKARNDVKGVIFTAFKIITRNDSVRDSAARMAEEEGRTCASGKISKIHRLAINAKATEEVRFGEKDTFNSPFTIVRDRPEMRRRCREVLSKVFREGKEDGADCRGLFTFVEKGRDESGIVDIVAIHGLNGHYYKTWSTSSTNGSRLNWLEDMLPERIPNARIMSYGYNANVQFSKSTAGIGDFVEGLLSDLILGGIVFKQALVRARERDRYTDLLKHIRGVAFFGTPHGGSSSADFGKVLASILKASTLGINTNTKVVNDLKKNSQALYEITQSFVDRSKALHIVTFYETEKMDYLNAQIVAKESAILNLPNEIPVPIDGNHINMCKFSNSGAGKRSFTRACSPLEEMISALIKNEVSYPANLSYEQQLECLRGFYHKNYESYRERNPDRVAGTCEWFLRHPEYREWRNKDASSLLWVSADPGCGKSVLAKFLVDSVRKEKKAEKSRPEFVCHFFFKDDSDDQRSSLFALRALLHQILTDDKALLRHAFTVFESKGNAMFEDFDSLWDVLSGIANDPSATNLLIILDALDECEKNSQSQLLKHLNKLYHAKPLSKKPYFKVILLSRPENVIKYSFSRNIATVRLRGEDQTGPISEDVELVVRSHINELSGQGLPHDLLSGLERTLITKADRTFLWTTLMIDLLEEAASSGASQKELEDLLGNEDIYAIYSKLLERSHGSNEAKKLLELILAAARPLTLEELNVAMAVTPQQASFKELEFNLKSSVESHLKNVCGHFIRVINSQVFLVHQTAREYLLQQHETRRSNSLGIWHNCFSLDQCHVTILQSCIYYLFLRIVSTDAELERGRFTRYASSFWSHHFARLATIQEGLEVFNVILDIAIRSGAGPCPNAQKWCIIHDLIVHLDNWRLCLSTDSSSDDNIISEDEDVDLSVVTSNPIPQQTGKTGHGCLHPKIIHDGLNALITSLLRGQGIDFNATDRSGRTLLHYACTFGSPWLVSTLLDYGLDAYARDNKHNTPLHSLTKHSLPFRDEGESFRDEGNLGIRAEGDRLMLYSSTNNPNAIIRVLRSRGVNLDAVDGKGRTALNDMIRRPTFIGSGLIEALKNSGRDKYASEANEEYSDVFDSDEEDF